MSDVTQINSGHINLRGNAADEGFTAAVARVLGQALPLEPNTLTQSAHRIYWLGPDEWQVVTELGDVGELLQSLHDALAGQHVAINDLSGGQVVFRLSGPDAADLLAKGCMLDLHPEVFGEGDCAQSGLGKATMLLGCIDTAPVYEIIVRRSFSEYALRWLRQN